MYAFEESESSPPWDRRGAIGVAAAALLAGGLLALTTWLHWQLSWPRNGSPSEPTWGVNFSCDYAEYLFLESPGGPDAPDDRPGRAQWCGDTLYAMLKELGAKHVRLSVYWDEIEPARGEYDYNALDAQLAAAERAGARVLLSVGMKAQRHPEYYIPQWVFDLPAATGIRLARGEGDRISDDALIADAALRMIGQIVRRYAHRDVIEAWAADNEPFLASPRANNWTLGRDFVQRERDTIKAGDTLRRPVVVNHAEALLDTDFHWRWALEDGDVVATSIYPFRRYELGPFTWIVPITELGPIGPHYAARARESSRRGKEYWITELQAEPWAKPDIRAFTPRKPAQDLTPRTLRENIRYARLIGAERAYFWGMEWWFFQRDRFGESRFLDEGIRVFTQPSNAPASPSSTSGP
jgi:hypothetical protein